MKYIVSYIRPMVNEHLKVNFRTYDLITEFDLERILTGSDDERSVWCDPVESKCFLVEVLTSRKLLGGLEYLSYIAISVNRRVFIF